MSRGLSEPRCGVFTARVLHNRLVCPDHYRLLLGLEGFPPTQPGQFVNIRCGDVQAIRRPHAVDWPPGMTPHLAQPELAGRQPLLRRPFSLAGRRDRADGEVELEIIHRVVGVGTAWLAQAKSGDELDVLGPLGNGFALRPDRPRAALLGGGSGIPPMMYLAGILANAGKEAVAIVGAKSRAALPLSVDPAEPPSQAGWPTLCTGEFAASRTPTIVATDDGSLGFAGLVSEAFQRWLEDRAIPPGELAVYACGPWPMMKAVAAICQDRGVACQLALERHMACGLGACQACIVKIKTGQGPGWQYRLACKHGPVFEADEIAW